MSSPRWQLVSVTAGPHPEAPDRCLVYRPQTGEAFELTQDAWEIAAAFASPQTGQEVAQTLRAHVQDVEQAVALLRSLGLLVRADQTISAVVVHHDDDALEPEPAQFRRGALPHAYDLEVHPDARFTCDGCGTCCERSYLIPLDADRAKQLRQVAAQLGKDDPITLLPGASGQPWTMSLANERRCPFLNDQRGCDIHEYPAQPDACRVFPLIYAGFGERVYASITHRCGCGARGRGPRLADQTEELKKRLQASPFVPVLPDPTRIDQERTLPTANVISIMQAILTTPTTNAWVLLTGLLEKLTEGSRGQDKKPAIPDPEDLTRTWADHSAVTNDIEVRYLLRSGRHIDEDQVHKDLNRTGLAATDSEIGPEVTRFVRDHLMGFRPYQYATLAEGLFALVIATARILAAPPSHAHVRSRIMAWEDALPSKPLRILGGQNGPRPELTQSLDTVAACAAQWRS